jgi:hypothetical protein
MKYVPKKLSSLSAAFGEKASRGNGCLFVREVCLERIVLSAWLPQLTWHAGLPITQRTPMLKRKALKKYRIACIETFLWFGRNCGCD